MDAFWGETRLLRGCLLTLLLTVSGCAWWNHRASNPVQPQAARRETAAEPAAQRKAGLARQPKPDPVAQFTAAIERDPLDPGPYFGRGSLFLERGQLDRAIADLSRTLELNPCHPYAYFNRGLAWLEKGDVAQAVADRDHAQSFDPSLGPLFASNVLRYRSTDPKRPVGACVDVLKQRLNHEALPRTRVFCRNDVLEVWVFKNKHAATHVHQAVCCRGWLEFRVLAHRYQNAELVAWAEESLSREVYDAEDQLVAAWVPVASSAAAGPRFVRDDANVVARKRNPSQWEVLVLIGPEPVDQGFVRQAVGRGSGQRGGLFVELTEEGAVRMGKLTEPYRADPWNGPTRRLGVLVDGQLATAVSIFDRVEHRLLIEGRWSGVSSSCIAAALHSGPLPVPLELAQRIDLD